MLGDNIKKLRQQKGYTQETLAQEMNVVRQTVSKWEKGYSVPDAVMLEKLAELLEVPVSDLLGNAEKSLESKTDIEQISSQLSILNDQFAKELARKKRNRKIILRVLLIIIGIYIIVNILAILAAFFFSTAKYVTYTNEHENSKKHVIYSEYINQDDINFTFEI
ncbi:MAG: helix-turn-helix transcriptional regulator [Ruminococcus sp.]|nr:helix-turn-helix transcriptional regulator [Ruminococcus sp.]